MSLASGIPGVIHLEVGEPDFPTPATVVEAAHQAALDGFTRYTPNAGLTSLRSAIASSVERTYGVPVGIDSIVVTPGAVCALATAVMAVIDPGDEVMVPDPGWPNYVSMVSVAGGVPVAYPLLAGSGYLPALADLEARVTPRTKLIIINTPSNPTGAVFSADVVRGLVEWSAAHDLYVLSDEVYESFVFSGDHAPARRFDSDGRVITVSGFSKTYAMTGWRLGYAVAAPELAGLIAKLQEPLVSCAAGPTQRAAETALRLDPSEIASMRSAYSQRATIVSDILEPAGLLPCRPQGAFYAFVDLGRISADSYHLARSLLSDQGVAVAPGETFGEQGRGMVRISIATAESELVEGCRRLVSFATAREG